MKPTKSYVRREGETFYSNFYGYCERCQKDIMPGLLIGQIHHEILCVMCFRAAKKLADKVLNKEL